MNPADFATNPPGKLVRIDVGHGGKDWAFIPDELPPKWQFDPSLWPLLVEAKEALGTLNGIGQILPDPGLLLRPLQNREAISSSRIEGTHVNPEQLLLFGLNPSEATDPNDKKAEWAEVHNYNVALQFACDALGTLPICSRLMKDMHKILLRGVRGTNKSPGQLRNRQVAIGSDRRFVPPPANELTRLLQNLDNYINTPDSSLDALIRCFVVHYQFETIHPFVDGNGRVGRALLAMMIYHWLGHSKPWLYMSAYYEQFNDEYVSNLYKISCQNSWSTWLAFCLRGVIEQSRDSIRRCHEFNRIRQECHQKAHVFASARTHQIIDRLLITPVITVSSIKDHFGVSYNTAKRDIERLLEAGILEDLEDEYPKAFYSPELLRAAYHGDSVQIRPQKTATLSDEPTEPEPPFSPMQTVSF